MYGAVRYQRKNETKTPSCLVWKHEGTPPPLSRARFSDRARQTPTLIVVSCFSKLIDGVSCSWTFSLRGTVVLQRDEPSDVLEDDAARHGRGVCAGASPAAAGQDQGVDCSTMAPQGAERGLGAA